MPALIPVLDLSPDEHGLVHYPVPRGVFVMDGAERVYARPGQHVHGRRDRASWELHVQSAVACDYCEAMRRIADGETMP